MTQTSILWRQGLLPFLIFVEPTTSGYKERKVTDLCLKLLIGKVIYLTTGNKAYKFVWC
jgi:hypothetical protein